MQLSFITDVFAGKVLEAFCRMLVHSLWQGLLFTIITGLTIMITKKCSAAVRYTVITVLFCLFIAVCGFTFIRELMGSAPQTIGHLKISAGVFSAGKLQLLVQSISDYISTHASLIMMIWFLAFLTKCVKMMAGLIYCQRVRHHNIQQPPAFWKNRLDSLCEQLKIKRTVLLLESKMVKIPIVIGHLKPIIFIPIGLLTSLPAGEVEAVLLHELAHIRRNDYLINMMQVIAENIFFFNPALLWICSLLREERENCCDDIAVAQTKSKKQFIQALISFKEHALHTSGYATAFASKRNQLLRRVTRLVHDNNKTLNSFEKAFFCISFSLTILLSIATTRNGSGPAIEKTANKASFTSRQASFPDTPLALKTPATLENIQPDGLNKKIISKPGNKNVSHNPGVKGMAQYKLPAIEAYQEANEVNTDNYDGYSATDNYHSRGGKTDEIKPVAKVLTNQQLAELDMQQALKDHEQAIKDLKQAQLDRIQAQRDYEQALKDRKQAQADKLLALKQQQMAEKERVH